MNSDRKSAASRKNGCKSCGPRTAAGKRIASRNSLRHGLAATIHRQPASLQQIDRIAEAICGQDEDAGLLALAQAITTNALALHAIREQQIAVIERLREPTAIALAKGDNSLELATARSMQAWIAYKEIAACLPQVLEKYRNEMPPPIQHSKQEQNGFGGHDEFVPIRLKAILQDPDPEQKHLALERAKKQIEDQQRDDYEALEAAIQDLTRLERYERRAWSRQKRAIRRFIALRFNRDGCSSAT